MAYITTIPLFLNTLTGTQGTGGTTISDIVDLREAAAVGNFSLSYSIASTNGTVGAGTAGSSTFEYLACATQAGTFVAPTGGTFGTQSDGASQQSIISFSPVLAPYMKIKFVTGTSNPAVVTAELNIR